MSLYNLDLTFALALVTLSLKIFTRLETWKGHLLGDLDLTLP